MPLSDSTGIWEAWLLLRITLQKETSGQPCPQGGASHRGQFHRQAHRHVIGQQVLATTATTSHHGPNEPQHPNLPSTIPDPSPRKARTETNKSPRNKGKKESDFPIIREKTSISIFFSQKIRQNKKKPLHLHTQKRWCHSSVGRAKD